MPCDLVRDLVLRAAPSVRRCLCDKQLADLLGVTRHTCHFPLLRVSVVFWLLVAVGVACHTAGRAFAAKERLR